MATGKRTTFYIPEVTLAAMARIKAEEGIPYQAQVVFALRAYVAEREKKAAVGPAQDVGWLGRGPRP